MRRALPIVPLIFAVALVLTAMARPVDAADNLLHLDVRFADGHAEAEQALVEAGFEIELAAPEFNRWQGWLPARLLDRLRALDGVVSVQTPHYARFAAGDALTEGDEALNAAAARTRFNVDGSGVHVAVISDGIVGLEEAIQSKEAPWLVEALPFGSGRLDRGQEGTAMIEIIHDLAPGASISFGAVYSDLDHIAAVNHFAQRADIIVDDVSFMYPADQRSDVSLNTTRALRHPTWPLRLYVTAAGNWAESHWSGAWRAGPDSSQLGLPSPGATHRFGDTSGPAMLYGAGNPFRAEQGDEIRLLLFWDDPWRRSINDYNLHLMSGVGELLASSETTQGIGPDNHIPRELLSYTHEGEATDLYAVIQNHNSDAAPVKFDLFAFKSGQRHIRLYHRTTEGSILAQSDAEDAVTVGAVNVGGQTAAPYSSRGPTLNGADKPELSAVDRVSVSQSTFYSNPSFAGSSAAAPHVAGVAALLLEAQPTLLAADGGSPLLERRLIREFLIGTARDIPPAGLDHATGAGLIDADAAIQSAINGIALISSSADSGPGTLRQAIDSGASVLLFQHTAEERTITLASELPVVRAGVTIDGAGWTLDASAIQVGLRLGDDNELWGLSVRGAQDVGILMSGDASRLVDVSSINNRIGVRIEGVQAELEGVTVGSSLSHGIEILDHASASISASVIESNRGVGVRIHPAAGDVLIGPSTEPPTPTAASARATPIGPLRSPPVLPRSGLSHSIAGSVSVDGLPAPEGATVDVYLDRRLAASVAVNDVAGFSATAAGPGTELRFAVGGVPVEQRIDFEPGQSTSINLRAVSPNAQLGSDRATDLLGLANQLRNNLTGIEIIAPDPERAGRRFVWGNLMQRNRINLASELPTPVITEAFWEAAGLRLSGTAEGATVAHLYAGPPSMRRYAASTPVLDGRFSFDHIDVDPRASEFSVIAHSAEGRASPESSVRRVPLPGSIISVSPDSGYIEGGETIEICGESIVTDVEAPRVWFGNLTARVMFWSGECVTVTTPSAFAGPTDIALLLPRSRPIVALDAFEYRLVRVVQLKQGWNFVTWTGSDTRVTTAFTSLAGATFRAYAWDSEQQQWQLFSTDLPPSLNTLRSIRHDQPVWIFLETADVDWEQPAPD